MVRYGQVEIVNVLSVCSVIMIVAALATTLKLPKSKAGDFLIVTASVFIGLTITGFLFSANWMFNLALFLLTSVVSLQILNGFVCASFDQVSIANGPNA